MSKIIRVTQLPDAFDGEWFWYVAERTEPGYEYISDDYATLDEAIGAACEYGKAHGLMVFVPGAADGSQGALAMEQAIERDERMMQVEVK